MNKRLNTTRGNPTRTNLPLKVTFMGESRTKCATWHSLAGSASSPPRDRKQITAVQLSTATAALQCTLGDRRNVLTGSDALLYSGLVGKQNETFSLTYRDISWALRFLWAFPGLLRDQLTVMSPGRFFFTGISPYHTSFLHDAYYVK